MATMMLKDFLDWDRIFKAKAYTGGHEILEVLFLNGVVLADVSSGDYQGNYGLAYLVYGYTDHAKIVLVSSSYGSCSGCDAWEGASEPEIRQMCVNLANDAHMFDTIEEAIAWLENAQNSAEYWDWNYDGLGTQMIAELKKKLEEFKVKGLG